MSSLLFYRNCSKNFLKNELSRNLKIVYSKQRKNLSDISHKNEIPKDFKNQNFFNNRNIAIFGIATGTILTTYLLGKKFTTKPAVVVEKKKEEVKIISDLPEEIEYLIIGGGSTSFAALRTIRATNPKSKVIVISNENYNPYMRPPLSKELWFTDEKSKKELKYKQWNNKDRSIFYAHDEFYFDLKQLKESETGGVSVVKNHKVSKIDPYDQYVILDNGQTLKYKKCLIATGSKLAKNPLETNATPQVKERILSFKTIDDFKKVSQVVDSKKSIALIGSEFLSSELACALTKQETKGNIVQILENKANLNTVLPPYLSEWTTKCLKEDGINIISTAKIISTDFKNDKVILNLSDGQQVKTDYLIIDYIGTPNTDLAKDSGLEICSKNGGFLVNSELQARTNLWVAGDAASFYDEKLGRRQCSYHDNSLVTGRLAGENMAGGHKVFWHQPIIWSDLGPRIGFEAIGLVDSTLPTISVFKKSDQTEEKDMKIKLPEESDKYEKGVVFYVKEGIVVGLLLWNVFNKTHLARRIINETKSYEDLEELAKLFELYKNDFEDEE